MGCRQKNFQLVWRCHQLLSRFLAKGHLPLVSRQSCRLLMIRVIMIWSWGLCTDLLAFAYSREKPQKTSARRPSDERAVRPDIASNGVPFLQLKSVGWHSTSGREKEGRKKEIRKIRGFKSVQQTLLKCHLQMNKSISMVTVKRECI